MLAFHDREDPFVGIQTSIVETVEHPKLQAKATEGLGHIDILADQTVITRTAEFVAKAA